MWLLGKQMHYLIYASLEEGMMKWLTANQRVWSTRRSLELSVQNSAPQLHCLRQLWGRVGNSVKAL